MQKRNINETINDKNEINVLTNNLMAAQALAKNKRANVVVTGGNMINSHLYVAGEMFMRNLDNLYISTAFLGVGGADMHALSLIHI